MKQLFHITGQEADVEGSEVLLAEIGEEYGCFARYNNESEIISELSYYTFDRFSIGAAIRTWLSELKGTAPFKKVILCTAFPQALLTPVALHHSEQENDLMKGVYDLTGYTILHDDINLWQTVNIFAVPQPLLQELETAFPSAVHKHIYTILLKSFDRFSNKDEIALHFTSTQFIIVVKKGRQLILVQTFTYMVPLDVVYVLLKTCTELHIDKEATYITLSGLIDQNSGLYKELYTYFRHLRFATANTIALPPNPYPPHFFTSIYNLVACAL